LLKEKLFVGALIQREPTLLCSRRYGATATFYDPMQPAKAEEWLRQAVSQYVPFIDRFRHLPENWHGNRSHLRREV